MAEKLEFELGVKGGVTGNDLSKTLSNSVKQAFDLEGALAVAVGVFSGNIFTKALSAVNNQLGKAVDESISFKRAQLEIETILPKNTKLTSDLVRQLESLSKQYGTSATSQAKAFYEIISAGVEDAADGTKLLAKANELATGGITDTANTIDLLTTIYNVYGKEIATSTEASDSLFKTVQIGKTTIEELSSSLGQALPIAKSFGIGLDEVGSILAQLTNSGITTSESVTLLNAVLSAIAKNGDKLGAGFNSFAVETEGLGVVLERLRTRTNGSNDALFKLLGRQEAVRAVQALTSKGLENYNNTLDQYKDKAGVAAAASKKIIDNDVGKQFDILGANIAGASRSFVDLFIPAISQSTKLLNSFFGTDTTGDIDKKIEDVRVVIARTNAEFERGGSSVSNYTAQIAVLNNQLADLSRAATTAESPLVSLVSVAKGEIDSLNFSIAKTKQGFENFGLPNDIATESLDVLNAKLAIAQKKLEDLQKSETVKKEAAVAPTERTDQAIAAELKLQADLEAIRIQAGVNQVNFEAELALVSSSNGLIRAEEQTLLAQEKYILDAEAAYQGELLKNSLIKDAQEQKAANDLAFQKNEDAKIKARQTKEVADLRSFKTGQLALEKVFQESKNVLIGQGFQLAAALAKDGSKTQFLIQKAAALAEIAIGDGKARALIPAQTAHIPFPGNLGPIAQLNAYVTAQTAIGAAIVGASAIKGFAGGGIVGASDGPDNRMATVRDGEMILNASQQKKLFDSIDSGSLGGNIVVQIDGREIFRAVRDQLNNGMRFE